MIRMNVFNFCKKFYKLHTYRSYRNVCNMSFVSFSLAVIFIISSTNCLGTNLKLVLCINLPISNLTILSVLVFGYLFTIYIH